LSEARVGRPLFLLGGSQGKRVKLGYKADFELYFSRDFKIFGWLRSFELLWIEIDSILRFLAGLPFFFSTKLSV
jgi:hypothetical protein